MNGYDAYKLYISIKNHFKQKSYNYEQYGILNPKYETYLARNDRYFFEKLSRKYSDTEVLNFFVANFLHNENMWVGDLLEDECNTYYIKWLKRYQSLEYNFQEDLLKISNYLEIKNENLDQFVKSKEESLPHILECVMNNKITPETYCIFDRLFGLSVRYKKYYKNNIIFEEIIRKYSKYTTFIKVDQSKKDFFLKQIKSTFLPESAV